MRTRIIIDNQDAAEAPNAPFTLNVYRDDDDGTESHESIDIGQQGSCLIGADIPAMLRQLADEWQAEPLDAIDRDALDAQTEATYLVRVHPHLPVTVGRSGLAMIAAREAERTFVAGDPVPGPHPDHQAVVPPMAGFPPYCTCGVIGGNGHDKPLLADHLRQFEPEGTTP